MADLGGILQQYETKYEQAQAANLKRYEQAMAIYDEVISRYQPGGAFEKAALQQLGTQKTRETGAEMHGMIGAGLYGTTGMGGIGRRWEESVGAPSRLRLEDIQMQRLSQAQIGKAGFMERVEDIGPDLGMMSQLMGQAGTYQQPTGVTREYGRTFGASSFGQSGLLYPTAGAAGRLAGGTTQTPATQAPTGTYQQPATGTTPTAPRRGLSPIAAARMQGTSGGLLGGPAQTSGGLAGHTQITVYNRQGKAEKAYVETGKPIQLAPGYTLKPKGQ